MPAKHDGFKDFVLDQLAELRGLTCRAMFGGYGLSLKGTFFGIIHKGRLYFKVTPETVDQYKTHGMKPFHPNAKQTLKTYYEVPLEILEHAEHLTVWASQAAER
jgi:DNA transformation protein